MALAAQSKICLNQRSALAVKVQSQTSVRPVARSRVTTKAISDVNMVVGGELTRREGTPLPAGIPRRPQPP